MDVIERSSTRSRSGPRSCWSASPLDAPFHVGVLFDNTPEMWFALGACAVSGATLVGINPTRRGAELARDVQHTDCALLLTEQTHLPLLEGAGEVIGADRFFVVDEPAWHDVLAPYAGAALPDVEISPADRFMLIFTSGTTGAPKAVMMSQGRLCGWGNSLADELRALARRRLLLGHAALPLERGGRRVHEHRGGGRGRGAAPPLLGERVAAPTCASTASRSSTTSASRSRTSSRHPSNPTTPTTR